MGGCPVSLSQLLLLQQRLSNAQPDLRRLDAHYRGLQPLNFLHPDVKQLLERRIPSLMVNWPRLVVGAVEERLDVQGFVSGGDADSRLWDWWQANDLDEQSQLGHEDALVFGRSYVSVWGDPLRPDVPRIAVESPLQVAVAYQPGSSRLASALKMWQADPATGDPGAPVAWYAALMLPDRIERWETEGGLWRMVGELANPLGRVPLEPVVNRPRLLAPWGESELCDVIPVADAVNKLSTDMMVSSEFHAMMRRWITGMETPRDPSSKAKMDDELLRRWTDAFPGKPWIGGKDVQFGQFAEASLENFINGIKLLQSQIAAISGLPPHYLGINADNPASADAIRSAESSLVRKAERKQRQFGGGWERVMRLAVDVVDGAGAGAKLDRLETVWGDASTPTPAQKADAAVKLTQGDRPIITIGQSRRDLDYSPQQITAMEAEEAEASATAATSTVRAQVELAKQLMAEDGLSQQAAFSAVGLIVASQQMGATPAA
jgi:hypothetical protein